MQNIEEINLITEQNQAKPNYSLAGKEPSIEVYFSDAGKVLIVGVVDNNYIYWASLTDSEDKELNANIFDYISRGNIRKAGHLYKALEQAGLEYKEVKRWVKVCFVKRATDKTCWEAPGESITAFSGGEYGGILFSKIIAVYMTTVRRKCELREAGGAYEKVLDYYLTVFAQDDGRDNYYAKVKPLVEMLEKEYYLYGSENQNIREKYITLREKGENLYNRQMKAGRE